MGRSLLASGERLRRLPGTAWMYKAANKRYEEDIALQHKIADEVRGDADAIANDQLVAERKASGENKGDLLDAMLNGRDPVTGKGLSPDNIRFQLVTFLIAGHEVSQQAKVLLMLDHVRHAIIPLLLLAQEPFARCRHPGGG